MPSLPQLLLDHLPDLALAAALAWGAGLRLYLVVFLFGLAARLGLLPLPEHLLTIEHPMVIAAAGFMALVELFADKLPWIDSVWDVLHTFVRIPAGAALAAAVFADSGAAAVAAGLLGGSLTAATHFTKAGTRAVVNASPEPFSNLLVSLGEDTLVVGGSWLAVTHPLAFLAVLALFVITIVLALRALVGGVRRIFGRRAPISPD